MLNPQWFLQAVQETFRSVDLHKANKSMRLSAGRLDESEG